jgi:transcriptional regulator with XRE-family HTH domain
MIRKYRLMKKMSQSELAWRAETSQSYISELESEPATQNPGIQVLIRISCALDISLDELVKIFK